MKSTDMDGRGRKREESRERESAFRFFLIWVYFVCFLTPQSIAAAALFLAAKVEEQPRKLEHVVRVAHVLSNRERPQLDPKSDQYMEKAQELVTNENIILQTLGMFGKVP